MSKQDVIDYVMETPHNTNRAVLEGLVDTAPDGFDSGLVPIIEYVD